MSEVLAVILSKPINFAFDKLFCGRVIFFFFIVSFFFISSIELSTSSKLGLSSFKLIKGALIILSSEKDDKLKKYETWK